MKTVSVIGAGTMGRGIAQSSALAGFGVILYDVAEELLTQSKEAIETSIDKGVARGKTAESTAATAKKGIQTTTQLEAAAQVDLIIEAAPEKLELKRDIFSVLDATAPEQTIFGSNTSSLSINALAGTISRADRFLGVHFFNPAHVMKLVELIRGDFTSDGTVKAVHHFVGKLGIGRAHV